MVVGALVSTTDFDAWSRGDQAAFEVCRSRLKAYGGRYAASMLVHYGEDAAGKLCRVDLGTEWALEAAVEQMDIKVSGGSCSVVSSDEHGKRIHYARNSAREVEPGRFRRVRWQGSEAFHKLYLDLLIDCCLRIIRSDKIHGGCGWIEEPVVIAGRAKVESETDSPGDTITLARAPDRRAVVSRESACDLAYALGKAEQQLRMLGQHSPADLLKAAILYVKFAGWRAAYEYPRDTPPAWLALSDMTVEEIWGREPELDLDLDADELVQFMAGGRGAATFYKRRQRLSELLPDLRLDKRSRDQLLNWINRLIALDAGALIADTVRWSTQIEGEPRHALESVTDYCKWMIARGHHRYKDHTDCYRIDLQEVRSRSAEYLIGQNGNVSCWDPNGADFGEFVRRYDLMSGDLAARGTQLIDAIRARSQKPPRLMPVLRELFLNEGGT